MIHTDWGVTLRTRTNTQLLSDEKIAVHAASESIRILSITYVFN